MMFADAAPMAPLSSRSVWSGEVAFAVAFGGAGEGLLGTFRADEAFGQGAAVRRSSSRARGAGS